ncbi:MAG: DNA ligase D, partial [Bacillota bacterium]
ALVLGVYDENKDLRYVGHAGGGFDKESLIDVYSRLKSLVQKQSPFKDPPKTNMPVKWVKPELVCEVSFSEWTEDGQLRQPIFEGLREDKKAEDVVREKYSDISKIKDKNSLPNERIIGKDDSSSGKKLILTNLKKIYWPQEGITKGDLIEYYKNISKYMLPYLKNRPHTLLRHPNGINEESFFQKDLGETAPEWIQTVNILSESNRREVRYLVCTNKASLLYMVNLGCIEINPWSSKINKLDNPDYMVIDLDPLEIEFEKVIQTALVVKEVLDQAKVKSYCKTSGSTGLHIYVPLKGNYEFDVVKKFAHMIAKMVNQKLPEITSLERSPAKRRGKVYIDYLQNKIGSTVAAPYSVRPRAGAPVSAPLLWKEVKTGLNPDKFTIKNIIKRLEKNGDFFKGVLGPGINIIKSVKNLEIAQTLKQKPITIKT